MSDTGVTLPDDHSPLRMSSTGYLMVALSETKDSALDVKGLKDLVSQYATTGLALAVYDHDKQEWVKLTKQMLGLEDVEGV